MSKRGMKFYKIVYPILLVLTFFSLSGIFRLVFKFNVALLTAFGFETGRTLYTIISGIEALFATVLLVLIFDYMIWVIGRIKRDHGLPPLLYWLVTKRLR
jgi:hypothetical protein